jgi:hypothetical protein
VIDGYTIELKDSGKENTIEKYTIVETMIEKGRVPYSTLLMSLILKPTFTNIPNAMRAFNKYFSKSKAFGRLFYFNFEVLSLLIMIGLIRFSTGLLRDKPVVFIFVLLIFLTSTAGVYLWRLTSLVSTHTIPGFYRESLLPSREQNQNWDWQYFLVGAAFLTPSFVTLIKPIDRGSSWVDTGSSCGTGGGSSCGTGGGSSCGSSCGGCGGGGD